MGTRASSARTPTRTSHVLSPFSINVPLVRVSRTDIPGALAHIDAVWKQLVPKVPVRRQFLDDLFNAAYETYLHGGDGARRVLRHSPS